jgi:hypothetical protein
MFSGMFSTFFFLSMMRLFLSLLQGAVISLFTEKEDSIKNIINIGLQKSLRPDVK